MRISVKGLQLRNKTFHFRRAVPPDLREIVGQNEWKKSLGLREHQRAAAVAASAQLWEETDKLIAQITRSDAQAQTPLEHSRAATEWAAEHGLLAGMPGRRDHSETLHGREYHSPSEADIAFESIVADAERQFGLDRNGHPRDLSPEQAAQLAVLSKGKPVTPSMRASDAVKTYIADRWEGKPDKATEQATKQFLNMVGDLDIADLSRPLVSKWVRDLATKRNQSHGTIKRRLAVMKAVFNHVARDYGVDLANPFLQHNPPKSANTAQKRLPLHETHLQQIENYLERSGADQHTRQIVTLLKFTGCRPLEIGGLGRAEVILRESGSFIRLRPNSARALKNPLAVRRIPLLGSAKAAAERALSNATGEYLFPANCHDTDKLSNRLKKAMRNAGVPKSPNLVPYSFRHTMIEALRRAEVAEAVSRDLVGHADKSAAQNYGASERPMEQLVDGLSRAIPFLGQVEVTQYDPDELPDRNI